MLLPFHFSWIWESSILKSEIGKRSSFEFEKTKDLNLFENLTMVSFASFIFEFMSFI